VRTMDKRKEGLEEEKHKDREVEEEEWEDENR
jgi:hypothetical protein